MGPVLAAGPMTVWPIVNASGSRAADATQRSIERSSTLFRRSPLDLIAKLVVGNGFFLHHPDVELKIPSALRGTAPRVASDAIRVSIAATYGRTAFREAVAHVQRGGKVMFDVDGAT